MTSGAVITVDTIDLDQVLLEHHLRVSRPSPVKSDSICLNSRQRDLGGLWDFDAEDGDEIRDGLPEGEPCAMKEPAGYGQFLASLDICSRANRPEEGATGHNRLDERHIGVGGMAQQPACELTVVGDRIHADGSAGWRE